MQPGFEASPPPPTAAAHPALALVAATVRDAAAGVAIVDGRAGSLRLAYVNDAFRGYGQLGRACGEDLQLGDAAGLGPLLEEVARAADQAPVRRRASVRQGDTLHAVLISGERVQIGDDGPWYAIVVRDANGEVAADHEEKHAARYARAAVATGEGYWDWNLVAGTVWFGGRFRELLGRESARLDETFASFQALLHDDDRMRVLQALRLHLEQHRPFDVEARLAAGDGDWRWFRLKGCATRDPSGRPLALAGRLEDVSERRRQQLELDRAQEFLRRILDRIATAVCVLNANGEIVEINRAWREFPSERALLGLRFGFGEHYPRLCRAAAERCAAGPEVADGIGRVLSGELEGWRFEYRAAGAKGEHTLHLRAQPFDVEGARGVLVTYKDVTELDSARAAARQTEDFYELILDSVPLHIAYVNRARELVYANRCYEEWLRIPLAALRGRRLEQLTSPESYRQIAPRVDAALSGRTVEFETRGRRDGAGEPGAHEEHARAGGERDLSVTYLPHVVDAETQGFIAVANDVTMRKRLENELRHAQKMEAVGRLTGGIAHDFNNLLSVVIGNLQLLERGLPAEPRLAGHVGTALRAALRGADLTRRLLAFSRQQVLEPRVLGVNRHVSGMQELVKRMLGPTIDVRIELAPEPWSAFVDPTQLESSILNLAINARDAMPEGGRLTLATRNWVYAEDDPARHRQLPAGQYVEVAVRDTGTGMSPEVAKRAFEPFFTTKALDKGTGLGLSIVYGFAEQSGGVAAISSEPDQGTCVSLYFPRSQLPTASGADGEGGARELPRGSEAVLVVDGDADVRSTTAATLRVLGYRVLEADTGETALALVDRNPGVQLLLCEFSLPGGMLGPEVATRARRAAPHLRVLHTCGFAGDLANAQPTALPPLSKPFAISELARRVRAALDHGVPK